MSEQKVVRSKILIDMVNDKPLEDGAVIFENGIIVLSGNYEKIKDKIQPDAKIYDYKDKVIIPGLVDCHTHHNGFGDGRSGDEIGTMPDDVLAIQSAKNAKTSLYSGVTTIRENGPKNLTMMRLRDAVNDGLAIAPRMVLCGRPVAIIGGHMGYFGGEVTGEDESLALARQLIKEGVDYFKITATGGSTATSFPLRPSFSKDELYAVTNEAKNYDMLTATHCLSMEGTDYSLDAGVDMIIHCNFDKPNGESEFDPKLTEKIIEKEAYVNPTLHVGRARLWSLMEGNDPSLGGFENKRINSVSITSDRKNILDARLDMAKYGLDLKLDHCRKMIDMGVKVITGSDSSWGDYALGNTVHETELLVESGYSNFDGLKSVTINAAEALGLGDKVGSLQKGKSADIVILDKNPLEDIKNLNSVSEVFFMGEYINRGSVKSHKSYTQNRPIVKE
jgi:imidazolonepropionase-like amidohydrolase